MSQYENEEQEILQSERFDHTRAWVRRRADVWDRDRIRTFDYGGYQAERQLQAAIYMGFITPLDDIEGETLLEKWEKVVDTIMEAMEAL